MVRSCGADASVVASWVGWIRTLTSILIVSLDGIIFSTGALSWSYGLWWFKEVRNGVRDLVCVISMRGLSSLDAWSWGFVGIFATSFGFTKCFCKSFRSLEIILQPFGSQREKRNILTTHFSAKGKKETFSQPISKFGNHFTIKRPFSQQMEDFTGGSYGAEKSFRSQMGVSQLILMPGAFS